MERIEPEIRDVSASDAERIAEIYGYHVLQGTASYDTEPVSVDATRAKIQRITAERWPFVVAELAGEIVGYAYVTQFRDRAAYRYACENSIYVDPDHLGRGIGRALLVELCAQAEAFGFRQLIAVVGGAEPASIALHHACGFEVVGQLRAVGWKKGRWLDTVYMQRTLGHGSAEPGDII